MEFLVGSLQALMLDLTESLSLTHMAHAQLSILMEYQLVPFQLNRLGHTEVLELVKILTVAVAREEQAS
jgi:hypothetical protein